MSLRLTPAGRLRWEPSGDEAAPAGSPSLQDAFETDWREALFTLAAEKTPARDMPKRKLADDILAGDPEVNLTELSDEALMDLVRLDVTRATP